MRATRSLEIGTGLFVILGLAALFFLTTQLPSGGIKLSFGTTPGYDVTAEFDNIGDLKVGAPVRMAGVRIGDVTGIGLDNQSYRADVHLHIYPQFSEIPQDSYASIETEGLLGGQYVGISPGGLTTYLKNGSQILQTQSAIVLESLINKFFANFSSGSSSNGGATGNSGNGKTPNQGQKPQEPHP
ncbi:MAG TPA: outer membrane lipid asymmetry maintenance protein MlaD [Steroidobacteraceae bacterium]|jgi:phospholipid/cholesterol/gamma-HCH transport system substrate-binding protein|nr:outer membrane lipid asymmetry maintenance protein MlaD [Steroidobacteraceae bacterium]